MILLGLAGKAGAGKDTVADYLVRRYGFLKFSFSDALYREVAAAFSMETEDLLRDRKTKDVPLYRLALEHCGSDEFVKVAAAELDGVGGITLPHRLKPLSPRQILQWWGTEYRRAQDPLYWIKRADEWVFRVWEACQYPEHRPQLFVNTSVRFPNEREWIHKFTNGQVWHIRRDGVAPVSMHESETPLDVWEYERELYNNDTIGRLYNGIELLLSTQAKFVKVEPMLPTGAHVGVGEQGVE